MTLEVVVGLAGVAVTILVVAGMILLTPTGVQAAKTPLDPLAPDDDAKATQPAPVP